MFSNKSAKYLPKTDEIFYYAWLGSTNKSIQSNACLSIVLDIPQIL